MKHINRDLKSAIREKLNAADFIEAIKCSSYKRGVDDFRINIYRDIYLKKKVQVNDIETTKELLVNELTNDKLTFSHVARAGEYDNGAVSGTFPTYIFIDNNN